MGSVTSATTIVLLLFLSFSLSLSSSSSPLSKSQKSQLLGKRSLLDAESDGKSTLSKIKLISADDNQAKLLKPKKTNSAVISEDIEGAKAKKATGGTVPNASKVTDSTKAKAKKAPDAAADTNSKASNSTKLKLSKTLNAATKKPFNSTKLLKMMKPTKFNSTKLSKLGSKSSADSSSPATPTKSSKKSDLNAPSAKKKASDGSSDDKLEQATKPATSAKKKKAKPGRSTAWIEEADFDDGSDLVSDFRELSSRLLPDLERLSITSKAYISAANRGIAAGVRPYVGKSVAPRVAPVLSSLFLALPLALLALLFRRLRTYLSLHRLLIFIQAYLAIYFATLAVTALLTGLEPLRFFYATSPASYAWTQAAQTMGYLVYLVVQLADLIAVFSVGKEEALNTSGGATAAAQALALVQMMIGLAVGAHYYVAVFHRAVAGESPRANWRVHAVYSACFVVICACARAERRKKLYEGEDGKTN